MALSLQLVHLAAETAPAPVAAMPATVVSVVVGALVTAMLLVTVRRRDAD